MRTGSYRGAVTGLVDAMPAEGQTVSILERFWSKVEKGVGSACWEWSGSRDQDGYGTLLIDSRRSSSMRGKRVRAHRFSASLHFGMFDQRLLVCHHCDNPRCVRPDHLYLGDPQSNSHDRSVRGRDFNAMKTHCPSGHEYTPENTYRPGGTGSRFCRECSRIDARRYHAANRERRAAQMRELRLSKTNALVGGRP